MHGQVQHCLMPALELENCCDLCKPAEFAQRISESLSYEDTTEARFLFANHKIFQSCSLYRSCPEVAEVIGQNLMEKAYGTAGTKYFSWQLGDQLSSPPTPICL